jgi:hypothetical protein
MTGAAFRVSIAQARAEVDAELAHLDMLDSETMEPAERATMEELRRDYLELRAFDGGRGDRRRSRRRSMLVGDLTPVT